MVDFGTVGKGAQAAGSVATTNQQPVVLASSSPIAGVQPSILQSQIRQSSSSSSFSDQQNSLQPVSSSTEIQALSALQAVHETKQPLNVFPSSRKEKPSALKAKDLTQSRSSASKTSGSSSCSTISSNPKPLNNQNPKTDLSGRLQAEIAGSSHFSATSKAVGSLLGTAPNVTAGIPSPSVGGLTRPAKTTAANSSSFIESFEVKVELMPINDRLAIVETAFRPPTLPAERKKNLADIGCVVVDFEENIASQKLRRYKMAQNRINQLQQQMDVLKRLRDSKILHPSINSNSNHSSGGSMQGFFMPPPSPSSASLSLISKRADPQPPSFSTPFRATGSVSSGSLGSPADLSSPSLLLTPNLLKSPSTGPSNKRRKSLLLGRKAEELEAAASLLSDEEILRNLNETKKELKKLGSECEQYIQDDSDSEEEDDFDPDSIYNGEGYDSDDSFIDDQEKVSLLSSSAAL